MMPSLFKRYCKYAYDNHDGCNNLATVSHKTKCKCHRGCPSQWFMAASPRHPMIYFCVLHLMAKVMQVKDLGSFDVVFTTGPGAVNEAFVSFMRNRAYSYNSPAGRYIGVDNRSVTIVGNRSNENMYITRIIKPLVKAADKHKIYQQTNMTHLTRAGGTMYKPKKVDESCMSRLYSLEPQNNELMSESDVSRSKSHLSMYY